MRASRSSQSHWSSEVVHEPDVDRFAGNLAGVDEDEAGQSGSNEEADVDARERGDERVEDARGYAFDVDATFETLTDALVGSSHNSSMLQDVEAERETEIGDVDGAVVELGREEGIDVPCNEMATTLVEGLERGYLDWDGRPDEGDRLGGEGPCEAP